MYFIFIFCRTCIKGVCARAVGGGIEDVCYGIEDVCYGIEDVCYGILQAAAFVDQSDHHALVLDPAAWNGFPE